MSDKTKVTLTRQAAADMLRRHTLEGHSNIDNMINFYVEAGMLEVVEELSVEAKFCSLALDYIKDDKYLEFLDQIGKAGLKITKA